jgi:purine-cytosine permease-like protein
VFGVVSLGLGLLGPIGFVRRFLRKFATYALLVSMAYLTWWVSTKGSLHHLWTQPGKGGFPAFGQAVDLVIGSIVSWTPLAADYTRFARDRRSAGIGAGIGYAVPTVWVFMLGALLVLTRGVSDVQALPTAVATGGAVALVSLFLITVDESEKAFADIYSTAVSLQNFMPQMRQRLLITVVAVVATCGALVVGLSTYQSFLFLLGSFFVPLFGVLLAHWLVNGAHYDPRDVFEAPSVRVEQIVAWLAGFCLYQWLSPVGPHWWTQLVDRTHPAAVTFTASLPSFFASFALAAVAATAARALAPARGSES